MKFKLLIILGLFAIPSQAQQLFTTIPSYGHNTFKSVMDCEEINNHYYFLTAEHCFLCPSINELYKRKVYKVDLNGNLVDSLLLENTNGYDSSSYVILSQKNNQLIIHGMRSPHDSMYYCTSPIFYRSVYDTNLLMIDSFETLVNTNLDFVLLLRAIENNSRIYYITALADINTQYVPKAQVFVFDSIGNFLFEKTMPNQKMLYDAQVTDSNLFATYFVPDSITANALYAVLKLNLDLDSIDVTVFDRRVNINKPALRILGSNKIVNFGMLYPTNPNYESDTLVIDLLDINLNKLKQTKLPHLTDTAKYTYNSLGKYSWDMANTSPSNTIFYGQTWHYQGINPYITNPAYYDVHCLDSNLNIKWSKVFGGNRPYEIYMLHGTNDGGCLIGGIARKGNTTNDTLFPVVYKVDSLGSITNIISLEPSANNRFKIYPNPSANRFTISNNSPHGYSLLVWNNIGQLVFHENSIKDSAYQFALPNGITGVYHYKLFTTDGKSSTGKLVVE